MNKSHKHAYDGNGKCSCGQTHDHPHENMQQHANEALFGQSDEIPAVFSHSVQIELDKEASEDEMKARFVEWVESLKQWAAQNKLFIGHIKIFAESEKGFNLWLSTTGKKTNIKGSNAGESYKMRVLTVSMTVIVFGTDEKSLRTVTMDDLNNKIANP